VIRDAKIETLLAQIKTKKLGDSIVVTIKHENRQEPQLVLHTSDLRPNFECWYTVMTMKEGVTGACVK